MNPYPPIMAHAREDLMGHRTGRFSPGDWEKILDTAHAKWRANLDHRSDNDETSAWHDVVRDFHQNQSWGYQADYIPPKEPNSSKGLGVKFIIMAFMALTVNKVAVLWAGQIYAQTGDTEDFWIFMATIGLVVSLFALFLWRFRSHPGE